MTSLGQKTSRWRSSSANLGSEALKKIVALIWVKPSSNQNDEVMEVQFLSENCWRLKLDGRWLKFFSCFVSDGMPWPTWGAGMGWDL